MHRRFVVLLLLALSGSLLSACESGEKPGRYDVLYEQLMNLEADPVRTAHVENLQIARQGGVITLRRGTLAFCTPIDGKDYALVFIGAGTFVFNAPNELEGGQIRRTFGTDSLVRKFETMVLFAADSTLEKLAQGLTFAYEKTTRSMHRALREALEYQGDKDRKNADFALMKTLLEGFPTGLFYAFIAGGIGDPIMYSINPFSEEEVSLLRRAEAEHYINYSEAISAFPFRRPTSEMQKSKNWFAVERCRLSCAFDASLELQVRADIVIRHQQNRHRWLCFNLHPDILVDSVAASNGIPLQFFREKNNYSFWIEVPVPMQAGKKDTIRVIYHGGVSIRLSTYWLPRPQTNENGNLPKVLYDITYRYPGSYTLVSVGKRVSEERTQDWTTSRWVTEKSVQDICFVIDKYHSYRFGGMGSIPVIAYVTANENDTMEKRIAEKVSNVAGFFQQVYGPCLFDSLSVTETSPLPDFASPGIVPFLRSTSNSGLEASVNAIVRVRRTARQWWGIGVDFQSYHDQWLCEGFVEFSRLWYTQMALNQDEFYYHDLLRFKEWFLNARRYAIRNGQEVGPVYLGFRNETSTTEGDHMRTVYLKGTWIMHMLRALMLDVNTMSEDRFRAMVRDFYMTYRGTRATTEDFKRLVDKHCGEDMSWFFNEWVYGTDHPVYTFNHTVQPSEGGYRIHCSVHTAGVSQDFQMPVLIKIEFGDGRFIRVRPIVRGTSCEFDLPLFPLEPKKVIFNDLESVLAEVE